MQNRALSSACVLMLSLCAVELSAQRSKVRSRPTSRPTSRPSTVTNPNATYPRDVWREDFNRPSIDGLTRLTGKAELSRVGTAIAVDVAMDPSIRRVASAVTILPARELPFLRADRLVLRVRATPIGGDTAQFRINCFDAERQAAFSKGMSVVANEWHEVSVPLHTMLSYYGVPRWHAIERIGLQFYTAGRFEIDSLALVSDSAAASPHWSAQRVRTLAFDDLEVREIRQGAFILLTDADRVRDQAFADLAAAAEAVSARVGEDFAATALNRPVFILLFERENRYRRFWSAIGRAYGVRADLPEGRVFAHMEFATAWAKKTTRVVNPLWVEASVLPVLMQRLGLSTHSNWLNRGLATYYRYQFDRLDLYKHKDVRKGFASVRKMDRIEVLTAGTALEPGQVWQAASLVSWMMATPERRQAMAALIDRVARTGELRLEVHAKACFELSLEQIEEHWTEWGKSAVRNSKRPVKPKPTSETTVGK